MAEIATINGISPSAISTINGVSISAIDTINGCTPGEGGPILPTVYATIDSSYVDADLINVPVGIELDSSHGILYGQSASDWRYLHVTSGIYELLVEVDVWDMTNEKAVLWVRCPSILSTSDTILTIQITDELNDYITVTESRNWDTFNDDDGDPPNSGLWHYSESDTTFEIQSGALQADHTAIETVSLKSWAVLQGDFDIQIDFDILTGPSTATWAFQLIAATSNVFSDDSIIVDRRYDGTHKYRSFINIGGSNTQVSAATSDTTGQLRLVRSGTTVYTYYYSSGWVLIDSQTGFTSADLYMLLRSTTLAVMTFSAAFDNLIINSCDSITAFVGQTGDDAAQAVWGENFVGVWHMSQDPSVSDILDSTLFGNDGTPSGSMTSDDSVYSGFGKAIEFDGTNDYFVVADSDELDLTAAKSMTMESFANSYSTGAQHDMLDKRDTNYGYLLGVNSSDLIDYYAKDGFDPIYITATTTVTRDGTTFYHFAGKVDRSAVTMHGYLNGVEDATPVSTSILDDCSNSLALYIGYRNPSLGSSWTYFYGAIGEVRISNIARTTAWLKVTAQNLLGNLVSVTTYVPLYPYIVVTIDSSLIDSNLTNFPIGIQLDSSHGILNTLSDTDWQYIHATIDGVECYVEVDVWDMVSDKAVLWVRCPTVTSDADATIKIEINDTANLTYVGETGDTAAQTVWDSDFDAVYHFSQDPSGTAPQMLNSVSSSHNLVTGGSMTSDDLVDGDFGKAIDFDGSDDYMYSTTLTIGTEHTIISKVTFRNGGAGKPILHQGSQTTTDEQGYKFGITSGYLPYVQWFNVAWVTSYFANTVSEGEIAFCYSHSNTNGEVRFYIDETLDVNTFSDEYSQSTYYLMLCTLNSVNSPGTQWSDYTVDELMICNAVKSDAWIKAAANNLEGNLTSVTEYPLDQEDIRTFTEVDSASDITITGYRVDYDTMRRDAVSYVYKDYGAGYFGDFSIDFEFAISVQSLSNHMIIGVSNTIGTLGDHDSAGDGLVIVGYNPASTVAMYLIDYPTLTSDSYSISGTAMGPLYCTFTRSGTTATVNIYSDENRTTLVDTVTLTCTATTYRYLYVVGSLDSSTNPAQWSTGYTSNVLIS